jgi:mannose-1-phosphate guanylyltransferase/mannose-6-phosphate isomerase
MAQDLIPVILSGGAGTRLWPLSREGYPKQLLPLVGEKTMLQETALRLDGLPALAQPIVVANEAHRFLVAEQLREIDVTPQALVLEPQGRNTAPAAAVAALLAVASDDKARILILPADHVIVDTAAFHQAIATGLALVDEGRLVTFGVTPTGPETGYGYIRKGGEAGAAGPVEEFVEKPDLATAEKYLSSGNYLWNSGMFLFAAADYLAELEKFAPKMLAACRDAIAGADSDSDFTRLASDAFLACPADSIDYAVMEKTERASVVPLDAGWSDVGSWASLHDAVTGDQHNNVVFGDTIIEDSHNCYVYAGHRLVTTVGLNDHVVIETKDAVLVVPKDRAQDVKVVVTRLKEKERYETELGRQVFRPWGSYDSIDHGEGFQVKRLIVNPGAVLSLQMHRHRAEHWVVVRGTARITRGEEVFDLKENESTYIPIGTKHRIENPGSEPVHIIEVQCGSYLGEDDIVRFEDTYGRQGRTD